MRSALLAVAVAACGNDLAPPDAQRGPATFAAIETEILVKRCAFASCHGGATAAARLDLARDACGALLRGPSCLFPSRRLVVPGSPDTSFLVDKLRGGSRLDATAPDPGCADTNLPMPYGATPLDQNQLAQVEEWIRDGAECASSLPYDAGVDSPTPGDHESNIASIAASATTIRAGESIEVTVTLAEPAPPGGQTIDIDVGNATVLGAPSAFHADAGATAIAFTAIAKRPARPTMLRASGGTNSKAVAIAVTGLALVELFADPVGPDDRLQWFQLANTTDVAIDLAPYTVGSGRSDYLTSLTQLAGIVPPHGCFVVGGPTSSAANGSPSFGELFNFSPDLLAGSGTNGQATGTALFDAPITAVTPATIPIDAVLCGMTNPAGLVGADGLPAVPACPDIAAGHSVSRTSATAWIDSPAPSPDSCPAL